MQNTNSSDGQRTRTFSWEDPMIAAKVAPTMSGMDFLQAIMRGEIPPPPIARTMDFELVEVAPGRAVFAVEPVDYHYNLIGVVHGGLASTLLDSALGCAIHTMLPAGTGYTTVELHVNFLRPLTSTTGRVRCEAEVLHVGRSIGTAQARIVDAAGKLYSHATTTCMIFRDKAE